MLGGAGMLIPAHFKGSATSQLHLSLQTLLLRRAHRMHRNSGVKFFFPFALPGSCSKSPCGLSKTIREQNLFRPGEKLLVAVSGGQDSVWLLRMLGNLRHQWDWVLGVVNCDHQWSSSTQHQGSHVSQIAASLGVNYYQAVTTSPVPGEGLARTWRYGVLQRIALRHGYTSIVTAHTASDRVETLLYNLFRGSGLDPRATVVNMETHVITRAVSHLH